MNTRKFLFLTATVLAAACSNGAAPSSTEGSATDPAAPGGGSAGAVTGSGTDAGSGGTTQPPSAGARSSANAGSGASRATAPTAGDPGSAGSAADSGGQAAADAGMDAADMGTGEADAGADAGDATDAAGADAPTTAGRPPATSRDFEISSTKIDDEPHFTLTRPVDLGVLDGQPLPVVVWANGGCFRSDFSWAPLFERWARSGFVVLSLTGTGSADDLASMLSQTSATEHGQLIDWVFAQNESGEYAGKLDTTKIVAAGNSCGGVTALELTSMDDRPAAVFVLSGSSAVGSVDTQIMQNVNVPVGYVVGGEEDIAGENAIGDYAAMKDGIPAMIMHRKQGDHITVSTDATILPQDAEIALHWMDLVLYGTQAAHDQLTSDPVCETCPPGDWRLEAKHLETLVK